MLRIRKRPKLATPPALFPAPPCAASAEDTDSMYQSLLASLSKTQIHGFLSQGFLWSSDNDYLSTESSKGDFRFNELGINFGFDLAEKLRVGLQLFSRSLGSTGNNKVQLDWAYADYRHRDWLGLRAGKMKLPMGFYNETRDIDQLRTCIFLPESVYPELERDFNDGILGFGIYGDVAVDPGGSLSYQAQVGTQNVGGDMEMSFVSSMENFGVTMTDAAMGNIVAGSLIWNTPLDGVRIGGTIEWWDSMTIQGAMSMFSGIPLQFNLQGYILWVAGVECVADPITFAAEFRQQKVAIHSFMFNYDVHQEGFYLSLAYRFADSWETGTYYAMYWPTANDRHGARKVALGQQDYEAWQQDIALSIRHDILENWSVKLEGHYMNGTGHTFATPTIENWFLGAFNTSFAF